LSFRKAELLPSVAFEILRAEGRAEFGHSGVTCAVVGRDPVGSDFFERFNRAVHALGTGVQEVHASEHRMDALVAG